MAALATNVYETTASLLDQLLQLVTRYIVSSILHGTAQPHDADDDDKDSEDDDDGDCHWYDDGD